MMHKINISFLKKRRQALLKRLARLSPFLGGSLVLAGAAIVLGIGDGASTLAGKAFGKTKIVGEKTLEGTIAGIGASALALLALFSPQAAIAGAVVGMLAEYFPINDNYTIPIAAAAALAIMG